MCGIVAVLDRRNKPVEAGFVSRLRDTLVHRGPDDAGVFVDGPIGLGHRRLSIIDLTDAGHQPMTNEDGSLWLVFNGEIYNYIELRAPLVRKGHRFASATDTEVILHQYEEDGERCVEKFRGMFAFVLWDARKRQLFAARDRFGIKPLYYHAGAQKVILASEIKAIVEDDDVPRRPDPSAIADYLYAGRALGSKTMFADINELEPGRTLTVDRTGAVAVRRYWHLEHAYNSARTDGETTEALSAIVDEAVAQHCRSDAPVGCHLSGGIDSSSVVGFAARHRQPLKTFSIKFSDDPHIDETRFAKAVARHVGAEYLECSPTADEMADALPRLVWHMDVPMATDGGFAYYTVSQFAKHHVKVSLTGHGGDEVFAGYPAQFHAAFNRVDMFRLYDDPDRIAPRPRLLDRARGKTPLAIYRALRARARGGPRTLEDLWPVLHCDALPVNNPFLATAFVRSLGAYSPRDEYVRPLAETDTREILDRCLYHDLTVYLPGLLHLEDRVSMAVSLESRVPLLDHRIIEFMATVPPAQKVAGMQPKRLLRRVAAPVLPPEVLDNRDKRGFPVPGRFWKTGRLNELVRDVLLSQTCLSRGVFNARSLRQACENSDDYTDFWRLINLELWFKIFIDRDPAWMPSTRRVEAASLA